jgi:hypothetical protein
MPSHDCNRAAGGAVITSEPWVGTGVVILPVNVHLACHVVIRSGGRAGEKLGDGHFKWLDDFTYAIDLGRLHQRSHLVCKGNWFVRGEVSGTGRRLSSTADRENHLCRKSQRCRTLFAVNVFVGTYLLRRIVHAFNEAWATVCGIGIRQRESEVVRCAEAGQEKTAVHDVVGSGSGVDDRNGGLRTPADAGRVHVCDEPPANNRPRVTIEHSACHLQFTHRVAAPTTKQGNPSAKQLNFI